jgi:hypothetical protein
MILFIAFTQQTGRLDNLTKAGGIRGITKKPR